MAIAIWMLYQQISWSVFAGIASLVVLFPLQGFIAGIYMKVSGKIKIYHIYHD
jgi:hypothetical protein